MPSTSLSLREGYLPIIQWSPMMTSSNANIFALLALCEGNSPVTGEFPSQRPVTRSFDVFFDLRLNKRLSNVMLHNDQWCEASSFLYCCPRQTVEQTGIWDVSTPIWRHCIRLGRCLADVSLSGARPSRWWRLSLQFFRFLASEYTDVNNAELSGKYTIYNAHYNS